MAEQNETKTPYQRLCRVPQGRVLAGVCTGLGRSTGIDPVVYRVGFAVLTLAHGQGILLYIAAALLMPGSAGASSLVEQLFRRWFDTAGVLTALGALLCVGVLGSLVGAGVSTDAVGAVTVLGLVLVVAHARGVNLVEVARSFPERFQGHPPEPPAAGGPAAGAGLDAGPGAASSGGLPPGMIDLATFGSGTRAGSGVKVPAGATVDAGADAAARDGGLGCGSTVGRGGGRQAVARRGKAPLANLTLVAAVGAGAAAMPVAAAHPVPYSSMIVMGTALAVVGGGLLLGGWFRVRGLATVGTLLTFALLTTSAATELPSSARYGEVRWRPVETAPVQDYKLGVGAGTLDLTALPVTAGQRAQVNAELFMGSLVVTVPRAARVELDARVGFGDLTVEGRVSGGPNARDVRVLEPEGGAKNPPVIVLRVRSKLGDVEVRRG